MPVAIVGAPARTKAYGPPPAPPAPVPVEVLLPVEVLALADALVAVEVPPPAPPAPVPVEVAAPVVAALVLAPPSTPLVCAWQLRLSLAPSGQQICELAPGTVVHLSPSAQSSLPSWVEAVSVLQICPSPCRPQPGASTSTSGTVTAMAVMKAERAA
jgi:hypothetical protein